jgi:hypothetical protein
MFLIIMMFSALLSWKRGGSGEVLERKENANE